MAKQKPPRSWLMTSKNPQRQGSTSNFASPPVGGRPEAHMLSLSRAFL
ncbi:Protein kinase domain-containing protein [Psidium guajava]|nr:Protein kinase domain-containing protein [Psidium guajava]